MRKRIFFAFLFLLFASPLAAQEIQFLPAGTYSVKLSMKNSTFSEVHNPNRVKTPLLDQLVSQEGLTGTDVTGGSLTQSEAMQQLHLVMGLSTYWNLYAKLGSGTKSRSGSITTGSPAGVAFAAKYGAQTVSGAGNTELGAMWRPIYNDFQSFRISLGYNLAPGASGFSSGQDLYLGDGVASLNYAVNWDFYLKSSKSVIRTEYSSRIGSSKNYDTPTGAIKFKSGTESTLQARYERSMGSIHWGVTLQNRSKHSDIYTATSQENTWDSRNIILTFGYGNLEALEQGPVALPWYVEAEYLLPLIGTNAGVGATMGLTANVYF